MVPTTFFVRVKIVKTLLTSLVERRKQRTGAVCGDLDAWAGVDGSVSKKKGTHLPVSHNGHPAQWRASKLRHASEF